MSASQTRLAVLRCAVVVCCHLANRLALTVGENERNIAHYITDFHNYTTIYLRTLREKCSHSTLSPGRNERKRTKEINQTNEQTKAFTCQLKFNIT